MMGNIALRRSGMGSARLKWGVRTPGPVLRLNRNVELVDHFVEFSGFGTTKLLDSMRAMTIIHLRFRGGGP